MVLKILSLFIHYKKNSDKVKSNSILLSQKFLKNKNLSNIMYAQKATENVFRKIFHLEVLKYKKRWETLGKLFSYFILETIILGKLVNLNPFDQPAVELIKKETKKILI